MKVIFFDAGGTLIRPRSSVGETYARHAADFGASADPEELERGFRQAFAEAPPLAFPGVSGDELGQRERDWWAAVVRQATRGLRIASFDAYLDALYRDFARPEAWEVFADVVPVLSSLRQRGIRLGVISNFDQRLLPILRGLCLEPFFDSVTFSSLAGYAKPDARIFAHALRCHAAEPRHALHVGDHLVEDVEGARAAGLAAVHVRSGTAPDLQEALAAAGV
jgi:putative hydrolase of the HAD superfamily